MKSVMIDYTDGDGNKAFTSLEGEGVSFAIEPVRTQQQWGGSDALPPFVVRLWKNEPGNRVTFFVPFDKVSRIFVKED